MTSVDVAKRFNRPLNWIARIADKCPGATQDPSTKRWTFPDNPAVHKYFSLANERKKGRPIGSRTGRNDLTSRIAAQLQPNMEA